MKVEEIGQAILESWTADEVQTALDAENIILIDVRTPQEYMFEHVEGALLLPLAFFSTKALPGQSEKRIVFMCGSGVRSEKVSRMAIDAGIARVAHLEGGFAAWKGSNKPYIGTNMATGAPHKID
ncbi:MAG: rhodanese-like domain-containing protein [Pelagimonas sp.]|jgi:rhodanese-related sulfurtransferase|nr:rhodanese-like domain-containing protein [Pelagimonas sp.]